MLQGHFALRSMQESVMSQAFRTPSLDRVRLARVALLAFVSLAAALNAATCIAKEAKEAAGVLALPERPAEIAPFMAKMDDQQARATLARVLEERTRDPKPERGREMLMGLEQVSGMLGGRLKDIAEARDEVAAGPRIYWEWLTGRGADPIAPVRGVAWGALLIVFAWVAQLAAGALARRAIGQWQTASPVARRRLAAAMMPFRWIVFLST